MAESDRLGRLVGDLLMLSTGAAADLGLDRRPVDLAELARTAVRRVEPLAEERGVDVVVDAAGGVTVSGDRDRLLQLILILVDNAIDHAPAGTPVQVAVGRRGSSALLTVTDQGPGIPERRASASSSRSPASTPGRAAARRGGPGPGDRPATRRRPRRPDRGRRRARPAERASR